MSLDSPLRQRLIRHEAWLKKVGEAYMYGTNIPPYPNTYSDYHPVDFTEYPFPTINKEANEMTSYTNIEDNTAIKQPDVSGRVITSKTDEVGKAGYITEFTTTTNASKATMSAKRLSNNQFDVTMGTMTVAAQDLRELAAEFLLLAEHLDGKPGKVVLSAVAVKKSRTKAKRKATRRLARKHVIGLKRARLLALRGLRENAAPSKKATAVRKPTRLTKKA